ncbi:MAG: hypothetical protein NXI14_10430 [bacterium]|nr:hypothetical protein [bacterium]
MVDPGRRTHRGIALLVVLGFIVIASGAVIASARIAATSGMASRQHDESLRSASLTNGLRSACEQWLLRRADTAVADADLPHGAVVVMDDTVETREGPVSIRIHAYDQDTRLPFDPSVLEGLGLESDGAGGDRLGLSALDAQAASTSDASEGTALFPSVVDRPALFGTVRVPELAADAQRGPLRLNPRTVPLELLESVFGEEAEQIGEQLREWRANASGRSGAPSLRDAAVSGPRDVTWQSASSAWAFRIDVEVPNLQTRSFWAVYEGADDGWERAQWHIIREGSL